MLTKDIQKKFYGTKIFVASHNLYWAIIDALFHFVHETKQYKIKDDVIWSQPRFAATRIIEEFSRKANQVERYLPYETKPDLLGFASACT